MPTHDSPIFGEIYEPICIGCGELSCQCRCNMTNKGDTLYSREILEMERSLERNRTLGYLDENYMPINHSSSSSNNETKKSSSNSCFIATAAYGTPFAPGIDVLREGKDKKLTSTKGGRYSLKYITK